MKCLIVPLCALFVLAAGIALHWQRYMPLLPDRVATHIDASGQVNQWADKASFLNGTRMFLLITPLAVLALGTFCVMIICTFPPYLINTPRKDYWLSSAEHRWQAALITFRFFLWFLFGLLTIVYFGAIQALVVTTITPQVNTTSSSLLVVGLGMLFIFAQVGYLIYCLYHPPEPIPQ